MSLEASYDACVPRTSAKKKTRRRVKDERPILFVHMHPQLAKILAGLVADKQETEPDRRVTHSEIVRELIRNAASAMKDKPEDPK